MQAQHTKEDRFLAHHTLGESLPHQEDAARGAALVAEMAYSREGEQSSSRRITLDTTQTHTHKFPAPL